MRRANGISATDRITGILGISTPYPISHPLRIIASVKCFSSFLTTTLQGLRSAVYEAVVQRCSKSLETLLVGEPRLVNRELCQLTCMIEGFLVGISTVVH